MDLHFTPDEPTPEEKAAVDSVLISADAPGGKRTYLLPVLHAIQNRVGWISPGALNHAGRILDVPPAEAFGVADFYGLLSTKPQPPPSRMFATTSPAKFAERIFFARLWKGCTALKHRAATAKPPGTAVPASDYANRRLRAPVHTAGPPAYGSIARLASAH